jgi:hypothetical protein
MDGLAAFLDTLAESKGIGRVAGELQASET